MDGDKLVGLSLQRIGAMHDRAVGASGGSSELFVCKGRVASKELEDLTIPGHIRPDVLAATVF